MSATPKTIKALSIALTPEQAEHLINQFKSGKLAGRDILDVRLVESGDSLSVVFRSGATVTITVKKGNKPSTVAESSLPVDVLWNACRDGLIRSLGVESKASGHERIGGASSLRENPQIQIHALLDVGSVSNVSPHSIPIKTFQMQDPNELWDLLKQLLVTPMIADVSEINLGHLDSDDLGSKGAELYRSLNNLLEALEEPLRTIARLKLRGLSNEQIAKRVDLSRHTIARKLRILRALWQLDIRHDS